MGVMKGDLITVDYVGSFADGTVFDTSIESVAKRAGLLNPKRIYEPIEFRVGTGGMIQGFDEAVLGMEMGETKKVVIPPEKAYGQLDPNKVRKVPLSEFKKQGIDPKPGQQFSVNDEPHSVIEVSNDIVHLYSGHPMAGKTLHFEITVKKILRNPEKVQI